MTSEIEQPGGDGPPDAGEGGQDRPTALEAARANPSGEVAQASPAASPPRPQPFGADGATAAPPASAGAATTLAEPPIYVSAGRPRGLNAYFAPGGEDLATDERRADERRNLRLLLLMVAALVLIPTLLTIIAFAQELVAHRGG